jgi:leucine rich repeat domain protein
MMAKKHFRIGAFALLLVTLTSLVYCSKEKEEPIPPKVQKIETPVHLKNWVPQPKINVEQPYMVFETARTASETVTITLSPEVASTTTTEKQNIWVDVNNNGVFDENTDVKITDFSTPVTFKVTDKVFTIYGNISELVATNNTLIEADVRTNPTLKKLNVAQNNLQEASLLSLVKNLPTQTATDTTPVIVLRNKSIGDEEKNNVTDDVLKLIKEQRWEVFAINDGKEELDILVDEKSPNVGEIIGINVTAYNAATVSWTAAVDKVTKAEALKYQVLWKEKGATEIKTSGGSKAGMLSFDITELTEKTTYQVWVKVWNEAGYEAIYSPQEITTPAKPNVPVVEHYGVWIGDKEITSENVLKIDKSTGFSSVEKGNITYSQDKIILKDVLLKAPIRISASATTFVIELEKSNEIVTTGIAIICNNKLFFKGPGTLTLTVPSQSKAISVEDSLYLTDECALFSKGSFVSKGKIVISKAEVSIKAEPNVNALEAEEISLINGVQLISPYGAKNENGKFLLKGNPCNILVLSHKGKPQTDPDVEVDANTPRVSITTTLAKGSTFTFDIDADEANRSKVWIDLNGNGKFDEGDKKVTTFDTNVDYTVNSQNITIYGAITNLIASDNEITAIKFEKNTTLKLLSVKQNKLSEAALLALANSLPNGGEKSRIILKSDTKEKNEVTDDVIVKFKEEKQWSTTHFVGGKLYYLEPTEEVYGVTIGGVEITATNKHNITAAGGFDMVQSGRITYDARKRILTLDNVTFSPPYYAARTRNGIYFPKNSGNFTLKLIGKNKFAKGKDDVRKSIDSDAPLLTITGPGSFEISNGGRILAYIIQIENECRLIAEADIYARKVIINRAEVGASSISGGKGIEIKGGSYIQKPKNGSIGLDKIGQDQYTIKNVNGRDDAICPFISYKDIKHYGIYVGGEEITSANSYRMNDLEYPFVVGYDNEISYLSYEPESNTLIINNSGIVTKGKECIRVSDEVKQTLKIITRGEAEISHTGDYGIYSKNAAIEFYGENGMYGYGGGIVMHGEKGISVYSGSYISFKNMYVSGNGAIVSEGSITVHNDVTLDIDRKGVSYIFKAADGINMKVPRFRTTPAGGTVQKDGKYYMYKSGGEDCYKIETTDY